MILKRLVASLMISLMILLSVAAQSPTDQDAAKTEEEEKAQKELEKKALALLDEVVIDAMSLRVPDNRFRIQAYAAIMLWEHDEKRARVIFREVINGFAQIINDGTSDDPENRRVMQGRTQLRQEILQLIANHDVELALEFLRATRQPPSLQPNQRGRQSSDSEDRLEMNLAAQVAANDPERALQLARESLQKGISNAVIAPLRQLRDKDEKAAAKLADDIINKLRAEDLARNQEALGVALNVLGLVSSDRGKADGENRLRIMSEQSFVQLLDMVSNAVLSASASNSSDSRRRNNSQNAIRTLQAIMPEIERYAPSRANALRKRTDEIARSDPRLRNNNDEFRQLMRSDASVDSLLEAASRAPAPMQEIIYLQAASRAVREGDVDRAQEIANDHISNSDRRNQVLASINTQAAMQASDREKLNEARQMILQVQQVERRVPMLIQLAMTAEKSLGKEIALQIIDEARYQIDGRAANYQQLSLRLQVARAYAQIDPARGFELIESTIDHLNELMAAAAVLDGFDIRGAFQDGEMRLQRGTQLTSMTQQCMDGLASLSQADFERARIASDRFHRAEARVMARLSVAQGVLYGQAAGGLNARNVRTRGRRAF